MDRLYAGYNGTPANASETSVSSSAVSVATANGARVLLHLQNSGYANVIIGMSGVTVTTGLQLTPGMILTLSKLDGCTAAWYAIREGNTDSKVRALPIT